MQDRKRGFDPRGGEDSLLEEMATPPVFLPGESIDRGALVGFSSVHKTPLSQLSIPSRDP